MQEEKPEAETPPEAAPEPEPVTPAAPEPEDEEGDEEDAGSAA